MDLKKIALDDFIVPFITISLVLAIVLNFIGKTLSLEYFLLLHFWDDILIIGIIVIGYFVFKKKVLKK